MSTEEQQEQNILSPEEWGARLTSARENISLSIEQVAADLNLPAEYIAELERGGIEGLPSLVFARGYVRTYAKLLNLDDDELVSGFSELHGVSGKGQIKPVTRVREQVKVNDPVMKLSSWIFVLAIIGLSFWWWQTQYGSGAENASTEVGNDSLVTDKGVAAVEVVDGSAQLVLPNLDDGPAEENDEGINQEPKQEEAEEPEPTYLSTAEIASLQNQLDQVSEVKAETAPEPEQVVPVAEPTVVTEVSLQADFIAECWVSIKDADGKTLFNNLRGKGQSVSVKGKAPVKVLLGAADAVSKFSYNGQEISLADHSHKNVVRMSLPLAE